MRLLKMRKGINPMPDIDNLSTDECLILLEYLAERISIDKPDNLIATQILFHARVLNGNSGETTANFRRKGKK